MARRARISPWRISEEGIEKVGNAIRVAREDVPEFVPMGKEKFVPMGKENLTGKKRNLSAFQAECALEQAIAQSLSATSSVIEDRPER